MVGAPYHDTAGKATAGAAYVFTRSGGFWTQGAKPIAADGVAGDWFGQAVALSGDTALVGAPNHDTTVGAAAGAAYVFTRSGAAWTQEAEPIAADGIAKDSFGFKVALSGDTALVGAPGWDIAGAADVGAAYVFERSGGAWTQEARPTAADAADGDDFGFSVALSGGTALIGAPYRNVAGEANVGAAYVFLIATAPTITSFLPALGPMGTPVIVTGAGFSGATGVAFGGAAATFTVGSATQITAAVPAGATSGPIAVATPGGTATSAASFTVAPVATAPSLTSVTPESGPVGAVVTLAGSGLTGATEVTFNGAAAAYTVDSDAQITATVPAGATSGPLVVTTPGGTARLRSFTVTSPPAAPVVAQLQPTAARRGATVTISGSGFADVQEGSAVRFGARACTKYVSWSDAQITCKVPAKAKYGTLKVTVTTAAGTSNSMSFKVKR